jgi:hypothetical protein
VAILLIRPPRMQQRKPIARFCALAINTSTAVRETDSRCTDSRLVRHLLAAQVLSAVNAVAASASSSTSTSAQSPMQTTSTSASAPATTSTSTSQSSTLQPTTSSSSLSSSISSSSPSSPSSSSTTSSKVATYTGPPVTSQGNVNFTYYSCLSEPSSGRALQKQVENNGTYMTIEKCLSNCWMYQYAGVEYGREVSNPVLKLIITFPTANFCLVLVRQYPQHKERQP